MSRRGVALSVATVALALVIVGSVQLRHWIAPSRGVLGVALGQSVDGARRSFEPGGEGTLDVDSTGAMEWHAAAPAPGRPDRVRIETREGVVAAIRTFWPPGTRVAEVLRRIGREDVRAPRGMRFYDDGAVVELVADNEDGGIAHVLLDATCPTHRGEAQMLRQNTR